MPTFTRSVSKLEAEDTNGLTAVANTAHWRVTCVEEDAIGAYGTQALGDPDPNNFTPLADVTEAHAISWLGEDFWTSVEANLTTQYEAKQTSTATSKEF